MGRCGENRLSLRSLVIASLSVGAILGASIPPAIVVGEPARMLTTFLGLISASVLPAVSLVIGSMSGAGRSVKKIAELDAQLRRACLAMFETLAWVAATFFLAILISVVPPIPGRWVVASYSLIVDDAARRPILALIFVCSMLAVIRALTIPTVLLGVLSIKRDIAVFEAQKSLREKVPSEEDTRQMFKTKDGYGSVVRIDLPTK